MYFIDLSIIIMPIVVSNPLSPPADSPEDQWPDITSTDRVVWDSIRSTRESRKQAHAAAEEQAREEQRRQAELERQRKEEEER